MREVEDEPLFVERVAGLDIAKAEVEVTIRVPSDSGSGRRQQEVPTFGTTKAQLLAVVVGSHGRDAFTGMLLGSVNQYCTHHADCLVVVVRPHQ